MTETIALTAQQQQPQVIVVPQHQPQNVKYVYAQPPAGQNVQYVYAQPNAGSTPAYAGAPVTQQGVYISDPYGHQPRHRVPSSPKDDKPAEVQVVAWANYKVPIPLNHATFMRKVFGTLILQLIFTAGMIAVFMYVDEIREWVMENYWMYIIGLFGSICVLCALFPARNKYPLNLCLLFLWTFMMAYTVATICAAYATYDMADLVMQAFGITILVFIGLSLFACQTKCNLMPLGLAAFVMLSVMFWWGLWALIFGWYNSSAWTLIFIIIFCLLILFDVWRMCNMPVFDEGAWILGAINLYLDVINLFLWILRCLAITQR